jgi:acyl-coenzyme A thioesterase PaaI-like protein
METFADASAVTATDPDRWAGAIRPGWDIEGNAHGGYLLATAARALAARVERPDPLTVTGHFLAPGRPGPIEVVTHEVRRGTRLATATGTVRAGDRPLLTVLGTFADLERLTGPELVTGSPPDLPDPTEAPPADPGVDVPPFTTKVDLRLHPDDGGFREGRRSGEARMRGWFRLPGGEALDGFALLLAADAFPPTIFNTDLPVAWTPTIELTVHVRARPAPGWLRCDFTTRFVTNGLLEVDGELWDTDDRLVAQSRQLALVPRAV